MRKMNEAKLVKIEVFNDGDTWTMIWKGGQYVHRGTVESFSKLLMKLKASDDKTDPKSNRSMTYMNIAKEIQFGNDRIIWVFEHMLKTLWESIEMKDDVIEEKSKTAKCPECGNKYLVQTGYCVSCKKKIAEPKSEKKKEEIEVTEEFRLPGTDIILEVGDKVSVFKKEEDVESIQEEVIPISMTNDIIRIIKNIENEISGERSDIIFQAGQEFAAIVSGSVVDDVFIEGMHNWIKDYV